MTRIGSRSGIGGVAPGNRPVSKFPVLSTAHRYIQPKPNRAATGRRKGHDLRSTSQDRRCGTGEPAGFEIPWSVIPLPNRWSPAPEESRPSVHTSRPVADPPMQYPERHTRRPPHNRARRPPGEKGIPMSRRTWQNDAEEFQRLRDALRQSVGRAPAMRTTGPSYYPLRGTPSTSRQSLNQMVNLLLTVEPSGADWAAPKGARGRTVRSAHPAR